MKNFLKKFINNIISTFKIVNEVMEEEFKKEN